MKYFIPVFLLFFTLSARAQITLEHTYKYPAVTGPIDFGLVEIDSGDWKYINTFRDTIEIYNLDHSLDRIIITPVPIASPLVIAKGLFTSDTSYCYLASVPDADGQTSGLKAFKEDGTLIFSRDSCFLGTDGASHETLVGLDGYLSPAIRTTPNGTKMIITTYAENKEVYSLPGKIPNGQHQLVVNVPSVANNGISIPTSAYPNPSTGRVRIAYQLPAGVSSGEVILTRGDGTEVKRYRVTSAFSDLLIDGADLPSGAYFYKLVMEKGESAEQAISVIK